MYNNLFNVLNNVNRTVAKKHTLISHPGKFQHSETIMILLTDLPYYEIKSTQNLKNNSFNLHCFIVDSNLEDLSTSLLRYLNTSSVGCPEGAWKFGIFKTSIIELRVSFKCINLQFDMDDRAKMAENM